MKMFGGDRQSGYRPRAARINRNVRPAGEFTNRPRIGLGDRERHVAGNGDDALDRKLGRGKRQQDRNGVVDTGGGIDDDRARGHTANLTAQSPVVIATERRNRMPHYEAPSASRLTPLANQS